MRRPLQAASTRRRRASLRVTLAALIGTACSDGVHSDVESGEDRPGGDTTNSLLFGTNAFLPAADNISWENMVMFSTGNAFFNQAWTVAPSSNTSRDGLGPLFNARSCSTCHFKDGRGRPPLEDETELTSMLLRIGVSQAEPGAAAPPD